MLTTLLVWRFLKFLGLVTIAGATAGAFLPENQATRQRIVYLVATPGLALTWIAGYGLLKTAGWSMGAPWIGPSILLSVAWLYLLATAVERPDRRSWRWFLYAVSPLVVVLALMTFRPG
jgi:hypothetical protein